MKYYVIAGEASGDLHGSNLILKLKKLEPESTFRCWGGDKMEAAGGVIIKHFKELAFMGFVEVLANIKTILNNISFCKKDIIAYQPDAIILIDYPGFNLRIATFAKALGIKVIYYISPQVWAWKQSRVKIIKASIDKMLVILPFEKAFYQKFNYPVDFVGHPLLDAIYGEELVSDNSQHFKAENNIENRPIIALLPGSRKQEISGMLPIMLAMQKHFKNYEFVVACAPSIPADFYTSLLQNYTAKLVYDQTYSLLKNASLAMVTSGTATLETALFNVPQIVCYKGGKISYLIAKSLIKITYISLVNLIMDKEIVKELIQDELNETNLKQELDKLINDEKYIAEMKNNYQQLQTILGGVGASQNAATIIHQYLSK
jgi:lipid-A-disaccharide synthase